MGEGNDYVRGK
jgi:hypothetical protein